MPSAIVAPTTTPTRPTSMVEPVRKATDSVAVAAPIATMTTSSETVKETVTSVPTPVDSAVAVGTTAPQANKTKRSRGRGNASAKSLNKRANNRTPKAAHATEAVDIETAVPTPNADVPPSDEQKPSVQSVVKADVVTEGAAVTKSDKKKRVRKNRKPAKKVDNPSISGPVEDSKSENLSKVEDKVVDTPAVGSIVEANTTTDSPTIVVDSATVEAVSERPIGHFSKPNKGTKKADMKHGNKRDGKKTKKPSRTSTKDAVVDSDSPTITEPTKQQSSGAPTSSHVDYKSITRNAHEALREFGFTYSDVIAIVDVQCKRDIQMINEVVSDLVMAGIQGQRWTDAKGKPIGARYNNQGRGKNSVSSTVQNPPVIYLDAIELQCNGYLSKGPGRKVDSNIVPGSVGKKRLGFQKTVVPQVLPPSARQNAVATLVSSKNARQVKSRDNAEKNTVTKPESQSTEIPVDVVVDVPKADDVVEPVCVVVPTIVADGKDGEPNLNAEKNNSKKKQKKSPVKQDKKDTVAVKNVNTHKDTVSYASVVKRTADQNNATESAEVAEASPIVNEVPVMEAQGAQEVKCVIPVIDAVDATLEEIAKVAKPKIDSVPDVQPLVVPTEAEVPIEVKVPEVFATVPQPKAECPAGLSHAAYPPQRMRYPPYMSMYSPEYGIPMGMDMSPYGHHMPPLYPVHHPQTSSSEAHQHQNPEQYYMPVPPGLIPMAGMPGMGLMAPPMPGMNPSQQMVPTMDPRFYEAYGMMPPHMMYYGAGFPRQGVMNGMAADPRTTNKPARTNVQNHRQVRPQQSE